LHRKHPNMKMKKRGGSGMSFTLCGKKSKHDGGTASRKGGLQIEKKKATKFDRFTVNYMQAGSKIGPVFRNVKGSWRRPPPTRRSRRGIYLGIAEGGSTMRKGSFVET